MLKLKNLLLSAIALAAIFSNPIFAEDQNPCSVIDDARYPDERRHCEFLFEQDKAYLDRTVSIEGSNLELSQCEFQDSNNKIVCADGSTYRRTDDVVQIGKGFSASGLADFSNDVIEKGTWDGQSRLEINRK
jgi:hypothetical protein